MKIIYALAIITAIVAFYFFVIAFISSKKNKDNDEFVLDDEDDDLDKDYFEEPKIENATTIDFGNKLVASDGSQNKIDASVNPIQVSSNIGGLNNQLNSVVNPTVPKVNLNNSTPIASANTTSTPRIEKSITISQSPVVEPTIPKVDNGVNDSNVGVAKLDVFADDEII